MLENAISINRFLQKKYNIYRILTSPIKTRFFQGLFSFFEICSSSNGYRELGNLVFYYIRGYLRYAHNNIKTYDNIQVEKHVLMPKYCIIIYYKLHIFCCYYCYFKNTPNYKKTPNRPVLVTRLS